MVTAAAGSVECRTLDVEHSQITEHLAFGRGANGYPSLAVVGHYPGFRPKGIQCRLQPLRAVQRSRKGHLDAWWRGEDRIHALFVMWVTSNTALPAR